VPAAETFYEVAQLDRTDKLNVTSMAVFSTSAALLPIFGVLLALVEKGHPRPALWLYVAALGTYVVLLVVGAFAYGISRWSQRPEPGTLQTVSAVYDDESVRFWVAAECVRSLEANRAALGRKAFLTSAAIVLLAIDAGLLSLAVASLLV
jgi:hypothetical protein